NRSALLDHSPFSDRAVARPNCQRGAAAMRNQFQAFEHSRMAAPRRALPSLAGGLLLVCATAAWAQVDVPPPPAPPGPPELNAPANAEADEPGVETLTRGPIHEAFANPAELDPKMESLVKQKPPADVQEEPPAYQPEGNFVWMPGYWAWDEDRDNFLWV